MVFKKGNIPWNKGMKGYQTAWNKDKKGIYSEATLKQMSKVHKGKKHSEVTLKKMSIAGKGKPKSEKHKRKIGKAHKGKKHSEDHRRKNSERMKAEKNPNWNNGSSFEPYDQRWTPAFRKSIRDRDYNLCLLCHIHREKLKKALCVHHIDYDKLNTIKENCLSLCTGCHGRTNKNREEWTIFFHSLLNKRYGYEY